MTTPLPPLPATDGRAARQSLDHHGGERGGGHRGDDPPHLRESSSLMRGEAGGRDKPPHHPHQPRPGSTPGADDAHDYKRSQSDHFSDYKKAGGLDSGRRRRTDSQSQRYHGQSNILPS